MKPITAVILAHTGLPADVIAACGATEVAHVRTGEHDDDAANGEEKHA